jgi:hypothetical protein
VEKEPREVRIGAAEWKFQGWMDFHQVKLVKTYRPGVRPLAEAKQMMMLLVVEVKKNPVPEREVNLNPHPLGEAMQEESRNYQAARPVNQFQLPLVKLANPNQEHPSQVKRVNHCLCCRPQVIAELNYQLREAEGSHLLQCHQAKRAENSQLELYSKEPHYPSVMAEGRYPGYPQQERCYPLAKVEGPSRWKQVRFRQAMAEALTPRELLYFRRVREEDLSLELERYYHPAKVAMRLDQRRPEPLPGAESLFSWRLLSFPF